MRGFSPGLQRRLNRETARKEQGSELASRTLLLDVLLDGPVAPARSQLAYLLHEPGEEDEAAREASAGDGVRIHDL